jgi:hypothetical protein
MPPERVVWGKRLLAALAEPQRKRTCASWDEISGLGRPRYGLTRRARHGAHVRF